MYDSPKTMTKRYNTEKICIHQTKWAVNVWEEWESSRNQVMSSCKFEMLSVEEMNFWLCQFVLEIRCHDGKRYTLQLI